MVEQFFIKFMAQSSKVNAWGHLIHGMTHDTILGMATEPDYVSVEDLVEDANERI